MLNLTDDKPRERLSKMANEQRIFTRVPFNQTARWRSAGGEEGAAKILNVSRGGLSLSLTRFFRPGPVLVFTFDEILYGGRPVEVSALTVWCHPAPNDRRSFTAGFSVVHGEPETLAAISEVFYAALDDKTTGLRG